MGIKTNLEISISVEGGKIASNDCAECPKCSDKIKLDNSILSNHNVAKMENAAETIYRLGELYDNKHKSTLDDFIRTQNKLMLKLEENPVASLGFNTYIHCEKCLKHLTLSINVDLPKIPQSPNISELKEMKLGDDVEKYLKSVLGTLDLNNDVTFRSVMNYLCYGHLGPRSNTKREVAA